jgi:hypothetical protein
MERSEIKKATEHLKLFIGRINWYLENPSVHRIAVLKTDLPDLQLLIDFTKKYLALPPKICVKCHKQIKLTDCIKSQPKRQEIEFWFL